MRARSLARHLAPCLFCLAAAAQEPLPDSPGATPPPEKQIARQTPEATSTDTEASEVPSVPGLSGLLRGVNAGLTFSSFHDSAAGWATLFQPAIGYSFNDIFAVDITVPIYLYRLAESKDIRPQPNAFLVPRRGEVGDVLFAFHAQFVPRGFNYQATVSATAPTGDAFYGLSTGRPTFDLTNRFDHSFRRITPSVELGVGDSSTLVNPLVTRDYTSLGPIAHFEAGLAFPILWGTSFSTNAYEQLPIGDQKIYTQITRRGTTSTVVTGRSVIEDNGFTNTLDLPIDDHTTVSAYYSRSLRLHDDVVSLALTYVLRGTNEKKPAKDPDKTNP